MASPTARWHPLSPLVNILNTARPSRTCQTLRHLFGTFPAEPFSGTLRKALRNKRFEHPSKWLRNPPKPFLNPCEPFRTRKISADSKFPKLSKQVAEPCEFFRSTWRTQKLRNPRTRVPAFRPAPTPPYRTCSWRIIPPRLKPLSTSQSTSGFFLNPTQTFQKPTSGTLGTPAQTFTLYTRGRSWA